ncbi:TIGR04197 family type VII secretion effector [uncultured Enterococcus sp.]|uniref:TIGR04197 family type VII secretion effector n=1 Tax=uncultured Enterococcus sp. TaxID=167972 RepID=UPI002AA78313|nr:TIGR04197 family type VII secretion effector [uncultured Enterococcus sp.]
MTLKNDVGLALGISTALSSKASDGTADSAISYAEETNLTAAEISKTASEQAISASSTYKELLAADAKNIGSLGKEFQSIDKDISQMIAQHF